MWFYFHSLYWVQKNKYVSNATKNPIFNDKSLYASLHLKSSQDTLEASVVISGHFVHDVVIPIIGVLIIGGFGSTHQCSF